MKFYIAGKFEEVEQIHAAFDRVRVAGHEVSYDWTTHIKSKPYTEHVQRIRQYGENELQAILDSDAFVYLTHERGTTLHMEFGAALAKKWQGGSIEVYAVGPHNTRSPWHFNHMVRRVDSLDAVFADLGIE